MPQPDYPVSFSVEYPDRKLNRLTTFFRIFTVIPIALLLALLSGEGFGYGDTTVAVGAGAGLLVLPVLLMLLFRRKYPRWWFDWNRELMRFSNRVVVYLALMDDRYPATDDQQGVSLDFDYPDAEADLNRWLPLVKWLLAIPHYIVLVFLGIGALFVVVVAWFAILITGRFPREWFAFVEGVLRWNNRVAAYAFAMATDAYPPFRLSP